MIERRTYDRVAATGFERRGRLRPHRAVEAEVGTTPDLRNKQIVHDLRQPAAAIAALASAVQIQGDVKDDVRTALDTIAKEADRISAMCGRLLDDAPDLIWVRLDCLVEQVVARARTTYTGEILFNVERCDLVGDELGWWRLLGNVVDNACRAAGDKGRVAVTLRREESTIVLDIEDSGPGFGLVQSNFGLGLPTVFRVVDWYRGHVQLGRSRLGGALVRMVIPALTEANARSTNAR